MTLTTQQRQNCAQLATYLEKLPLDYKHFGMRTFMQSPEGETDLEEFGEYALNNGGVDQFPCGTAACAVGHGPAAGLLFTLDEMPDGASPDWGLYSQRFADESSSEWLWMFSGTWSNIDNSHRGAAARIRYLLNDGEMIPREGYLHPDDFHLINLYRNLIV